MDINEITLNNINVKLQQLKDISQNISNVNTPGYLAQQSFVEKLGQQQAIRTNYSSANATINSTNRSLDVAIKGSGYFLINKNDAFYVSKNGHFYLDNDGVLRHISGGFVVGDTGKIQLDGQSLHIAEDGKISSMGSVIATIKRVALTKPQLLTAIGSSLYSTPLNNLVNSNVSVQAGALNASNVNNNHEMAQMIDISRQLQSSQKVINAYEQMLNTGINELGKK